MATPDESKRLEVAPNGGPARVISRLRLSLSVMSYPGETCRQNVEPGLGDNDESSKQGLVLSVVGAKLGAIGGRRRATLGLLNRSIQAVHQESGHALSHLPT